MSNNLDNIKFAECQETNQAYSDGFDSVCATYGLEPDTVVKQAQFMSGVGNYLGSGGNILGKGYAGLTGGMQGMQEHGVSGIASGASAGVDNYNKANIAQRDLAKAQMANTGVSRMGSKIKGYWNGGTEGAGAVGNEAQTQARVADARHNLDMARNNVGVGGQGGAPDGVAPAKTVGVQQDATGVVAPKKPSNWLYNDDAPMPGDPKPAAQVPGSSASAVNVPGSPASASTVPGSPTPTAPQAAPSSAVADNTNPFTLPQPTAPQPFKLPVPGYGPVSNARTA